MTYVDVKLINCNLLSFSAMGSASGSGNGLGNGSENSGHISVANCRRKEEPHIEQMPQPKKPRLVFTDLQRRTLQAIFKVSTLNGC